MTATIANPLAPVDRDLLIGGIFHAPRERVFQAWSEAEHARHWWAPRHFVVTACEIDFRVGGAWRVRIESPDWGVLWIGGTYLEIVAPERLVFTFATEDWYGEPGPETLVSVTFSELGARTMFTLSQGAFDDIDTRNGHEDGWLSAFDVLAGYLARF
jgi:uncharacterized protein YndB with AHSA1/START domain